MSGSESLTHEFVFEICELVFVKLSLANGQKLPAENL